MSYCVCHMASTRQNCHVVARRCMGGRLQCRAICAAAGHCHTLLPRIIDLFAVAPPWLLPVLESNIISRIIRRYVPSFNLCCDSKLLVQYIYLFHLPSIKDLPTLCIISARVGPTSIGDWPHSSALKQGKSGPRRDHSERLERDQPIGIDIEPSPPRVEA